MEGDLKLALAVQVIAGNCGIEALRLLLTPGNRLKEKVIRTIGATGPGRQVYAMAEAAAGRDPTARSAGGVWPMDTRDFGEVASRLRRALGLVDWVIADIPRMPANLRPTPEEEGEMLGHLEEIMGLSPQLLRLVAERGTGATAKGRKANRRTPASAGAVARNLSKATACRKSAGATGSLQRRAARSAQGSR